MLSDCPLTRSTIESLIPHAAGMCLHDEVLSWDNDAIHCRSTGHRNAEHVLRKQGKLSSVHLIEFGAQAMAIHGGLMAAQTNDSARPGFLATVRRADLDVEWLDDIDAPLDVVANRIAGSDAGWTYDFKVTAADQPLASGRVSVMFMPEIEE